MNDMNGMNGMSNCMWPRSDVRASAAENPLSTMSIMSIMSLSYARLMSEWPSDTFPGVFLENHILRIGQPAECSIFLLCVDGGTILRSNKNALLEDTATCHSMSLMRCWPQREL